MESIALLSIGKRRTQLLPHHRLDLLYEDNNMDYAVRVQAVLARDGVVHSSPSKCSRKPDSMCPMCLVSLRGLDRDRRCVPTGAVGATGATAVTAATAADDTRRRGGVWESVENRGTLSLSAA